MTKPVAPDDTPPPFDQAEAEALVTALDDVKAGRIRPLDEIRAGAAKPVAPDDTPTRLHQVRETTKMMDKDVRLQQMRLDPPGGDHQQPCDCNICFLWADVSRLQQENALLKRSLAMLCRQADSGV
jgi:hypothetical protein